MTIGVWKPAPRGIPTAHERLDMVLRLLNRDKVAEVAIYVHGTAVIRSVGGLLAIDDLMRSYDLPSDGAGSPMGDICCPMCFDDGSVLYGWEFIGTGQGGAMSILTEAELVPHMSLNAEDIFLGPGLWARGRRTLDARSPERVAHWNRSTETRV